MELSDMSFGGTRVPWNSMEYSMEFHGTNWYFIWRHKSSMEFHGIFHGIQWNTCVICNGALPIPWNPMELGDFLFGDCRVPWNSMEYPVGVQPGQNAIKWQSQSSMGFHGTKWYFIWRHQSSMEFHGMFPGIPWNLVICHLAAPEFHGIPWNIPWNSMEHLCHW